MNHTNKILQAWVGHLQGIEVTSENFTPASSLHEIIVKFDLRNNCRKIKYIERRQAFIRYVYFDLKYTVIEIGKMLNRNHSSISNYLKKIYDGRCEDNVHLENTIGIRKTIEYYDAMYHQKLKK